MSSDAEKVAMVTLGLFAHFCLVFVPTIGEFRPTVGSVAFAFATLVIASQYDMCLFAPCWKEEHPSISRLLEFLVRLGVLNFAITTIWLPIVIFLSSNTYVIAILVWPLDALLMCGAAAKWANDPEAPRQMAALFALGTAACAVYVTDFCSCVGNAVRGCSRMNQRHVRIVDNLQQNEPRPVLRPILKSHKTI